MSIHDNGNIIAQVGAKIRRQRQASGLTLHELARLSGISSSALSLIETGKRDARLSTLDKIGRSLNTEIATFFGCSIKAEPGRNAGLGRGYDLSELE
jgi:transcriptional regulator with XRE-family HTH domain